VQTVLVVDDEWAIADWLHALLDDEGYDVLVASNGKQALELLRRQKADLIVSDFMMPILDGPGLLRELAKSPGLSGIPVIVMSSLQETAVRERCDGYKAFLRKPFREADVLKTIQRVLSADEK
jgi:CheY-like chemotaxis protein